MPVRVRYKVETAISSSTSEERDLGNKKWEVVSDGLGEGGTWKTLVVATTVDLEVTLRDVSDAKLFCISTNAKDPNQSPVSIELKRNSVAGEVIEIVPLSGAAQGHMLLTTTGLTAIFLSNPGAVDMEVVIAVSGD